MVDLFWPGAERAGSHFTAEDFLGAMLAVEEEWLGAPISYLVDSEDLALRAEAGGNPVIALVELIRETYPGAHRGLTSQDVVDSALMRMAESAVSTLRRDLATVVRGRREMRRLAYLSFAAPGDQDRG